MSAVCRHPFRMIDGDPLQIDRLTGNVAIHEAAETNTTHPTPRMTPRSLEPAARSPSLKYPPSGARRRTRRIAAIIPALAPRTMSAPSAHLMVRY